ncbi:hypothetical protein DAPPUDRAFT_252443 [Daphnia pulex]|uniref:Uncharacterized protein n=1 Tax=Daphnia pulex TaxID=6669 RepID=E9H2P7_DAPPU|nr:hypothetical protein DAPPUDRAFT_252443 [Daphnia pulex]|eukprot:EFX74008.1 hypothetical protein DAPPUDRAFT_252443 [Daphnia pulex]
MDPVPTPPSLNPDLSESSSATIEELFVHINPDEIGSPDVYGISALIIDESDDNNALAKDSVDPPETPRTAKHQQPFTVNCPEKTVAETSNNDAIDATMSLKDVRVGFFLYAAIHINPVTTPG